MRNAVHRSWAGSAGRLAKLPRIFFCLTVAVALQPAAAWAARPAAPQNPATSGTSLTQGRPASGDPISLAGHDRDVTVESLKLPAGFCRVVNAQRPGAAPDCRVVHYSHTVDGASPSVMRPAGLDPGYWHWSQWDQMCSVAGCGWWSVTMTEDGEANGTNVWQWNHGCSPYGYETSITWCGFLWNGGGAPMYRVQFGADYNACVGPQGVGCIAHGMRRDIDDWGHPGAFSSF